MLKQTCNSIQGGIAMNIRFKALASILAVFAFADVFSGCAKKQSQNIVPDIQKSKSKEIIVWSHLNEDEISEVKKTADVWAKKTGNTVKVQSDKSNFQSYMQSVQSGRTPDIMFGISHESLGAFYKENLLAEVPSNAVDKLKYVDSTLKAVSYNGKMYAVPISMETYTIFYNIDKVEDPPLTLDDLIAQGKKAGFQYDINNFYFSYAFIAGSGGYIFKNNGKTIDTKDIGLDSRGAAKGYQLLADFIQKYKFMPASIKGEDAKSNFENGKIGLYIGNLKDIDEFKKSEIKFEAAPLPSLSGRPCPSLMSVQTAFVSSKSKNKKEAWDLMKYLTQNTSAALFKTSGRIPVLKSELEKDYIKNDKTLTAFAKQSENAEPVPNISEMAAVWKTVCDNIALITQGKLKPADAGKQITEQINKQIAGEAAKKK